MLYLLDIAFCLAVFRVLSTKIIVESFMIARPGPDLLKKQT